jgi:hypothetical protein
LRDLIVSYHRKFGDEITFIPGAYFANMYNTREQVNRDLHEGLKRVSEIVGDGYRPKSVVAGFLSAENLRYLAEEEGIHVCQGTIWSQYAVDNGDGEGSIAYPYYPSREHFCKPARGKDDFIDIVNLDGWTVDFLCARIPGARTVEWRALAQPPGRRAHRDAARHGHRARPRGDDGHHRRHFDDGFARNGFAWVTCGWEMSLVEARKIYGYGGRNGMEGLHLWLTGIRERWPDAQTHHPGRVRRTVARAFQEQRQLDYRFVHRGCGIRASEADKEIRWFMNRTSASPCCATGRKRPGNGHRLHPLRPARQGTRRPRTRQTLAQLEPDEPHQPERHPPAGPAGREDESPPRPRLPIPDRQSRRLRTRTGAASPPSRCSAPTTAEVSAVRQTHGPRVEQTIRQ